MTRACRPLPAFLLGLALVAGCDSGVRRVPAGGAVTLDGRPLERGRLMFYPDPAKGNQARVNCGAPVGGGRYTLATAGVTPNDAGAGAPLGWYRVVLLDEEEKGRPRLNVHPKYCREETTPLAVEIVESPAPGAYDVALTSK